MCVLSHNRHINLGYISFPQRVMIRFCFRRFSFSGHRIKLFSFRKKSEWAKKVNNILRGRLGIRRKLLIAYGPELQVWVTCLKHSSSGIYYSSLRCHTLHRPSGMPSGPADGASGQPRKGRAHGRREAGIEGEDRARVDSRSILSLTPLLVTQRPQIHCSNRFYNASLMRLCLCHSVLSGKLLGLFFF